jgi:hypothetical protein
MNEAPIDYAALMSAATSSEVDAIADHLAAELPWAWLDAYRATSAHAANVYQIDVNGYEYLFDFSTELVARGELDSREAIEDRVVAVHGRSRRSGKPRSDGIMQRQPQGPVEFVSPVLKGRYDRGHFVAHATGGELHINIFPQLTGVNRGWSDVGKVYRAMELYCSTNPGTYYFSRPLYLGRAAHPFAVEFGVLKKDGVLWVNRFPNCTSDAEMDEIERLLSEKLASDAG